MSYPVKRKSIRSQNTIDRLNDDVLREIFVHLHDLDLFAVADVCSTFKRNAQAEFSSRYKHKRLKISVQDPSWIESTDNFFTENRIHPGHLSSVLRNFGPLMNSFGMHWDNSPHMQVSRAMELIYQYRDATLNELCLRNIVFNANDISNIRPLIQVLKGLELERCIWAPKSLAFNFFPVCSKLHSLSINYGAKFDFYNRVTFPQLKSFAIKNCGVKNESFKNFLAIPRNSQSTVGRDTNGSDMQPHK